MAEPTAGKMSTRQEQANVRRRQILDAAVRLFARQGISATTTRQIAQEIGVTEGLIFHYFPGKLDLVRAVTGSPYVITGDLQRILQEAGGQPIAEVLGVLAATWLDLLRREADLSSIIFGEALINPELGDILQQVITQGSDGIEKLLDTRKQSGEITTSLDSKTIAHMYMASLMMFFLRNRRLDDAGWQRESAAFAENLRAAWMRMVRP